MRRNIAAVLIPTLLLLAAAASSAEGIAVYHSPDDSGTNFGPIIIPLSGTTTLRIYLDAGSVPSSGPEPCCTGQGDEVLGWDLRFQAFGDLAIDSVAPVGDVTVKQTATLLSMNGGDFQHGSLGPTKIADVDVQTAGAGVLKVVFGQVVGASLELETVEPTIVVDVPEPSSSVVLILGAALLAVSSLRRRPRGVASS